MITAHKFFWLRLVHGSDQATLQPRVKHTQKKLFYSLQKCLQTLPQCQSFLACRVPWELVPLDPQAFYAWARPSCSAVEFCQGSFQVWLNSSLIHKLIPFRSGSVLSKLQAWIDFKLIYIYIFFLPRYTLLGKKTWSLKKLFHLPSPPRSRWL